MRTCPDLPYILLCRVAIVKKIDKKKKISVDSEARGREASHNNIERRGEHELGLSRSLDLSESYVVALFRAI